MRVPSVSEISNKLPSPGYDDAEPDGEDLAHFLVESTLAEFDEQIQGNQEPKLIVASGVVNAILNRDVGPPGGSALYAPILERAYYGFANPQRVTSSSHP